ncbi:MAG: isochorismatase family protein [bacterium]|nr:isochorismatase family protein [bacterium]
MQLTDVLLVIDVQPTFMPGGGLPVPQGDAVIAPILDLLRMFPCEQRIATKERHPSGHIAFASSYYRLPAFTRMTRQLLEERVREYGPQRVLSSHAKFTLDDVRRYLAMVGHFTLWNDHSEAGTPDAELHPDLPPEHEFSYVLVKGGSPIEHAYSAFISDIGTATELEDVLRMREFRRVFGVGLAFDYCVGWTLLHAADRGFEVYCIEDATRAVNQPKDSVEEMRERFRKRGVQIIQSSDLLAA